MILLTYLPWIIGVLGIIAVYISATMNDVTKRRRAVAISFIITVSVLFTLQAWASGHTPLLPLFDAPKPSTQYQYVAGEIPTTLRSPNLMAAELKARDTYNPNWQQNQQLLRDEALLAELTALSAAQPLQPVIEFRHATDEDQADKPIASQ